MTVSADELKLRIKVVRLALDLLNSRAHYYWGAPDTGQVPLRPDDFSKDPNRRHILAASTDGLHFCAGRCYSDDVKNRPKFSGSAPLDVWQAVLIPARFPRFYQDGDTVHPSKSEVVFGESCSGKMHFDCGSFVRYCFRTVLGPNLVAPNIQMHDLAKQIWSSSPPSGGALEAADILPADIVYSTGGGHVGLTTGKAAYLTSANKATDIPADHSVHAFYAKMGVVKTRLVGDDPVWGEVRRWQKWS